MPRIHEDADVQVSWCQWGGLFAHSKAGEVGEAMGITLEQAKERVEDTTSVQLPSQLDEVTAGIGLIRDISGGT